MCEPKGAHGALQHQSSPRRANRRPSTEALIQSFTHATALLLQSPRKATCINESEELDELEELDDDDEDPELVEAAEREAQPLGAGGGLNAEIVLDDAFMFEELGEKASWAKPTREELVKLVSEHKKGFGDGSHSSRLDSIYNRIKETWKDQNISEYQRCSVVFDIVLTLAHDARRQ